jgi:hypothetical protein
VSAADLNEARKAIEAAQAHSQTLQHIAQLQRLITNNQNPTPQ